MKKLVIVFISIVVMLFFLILYININDNRYLLKIKNNILDNTEINSVNYINEYNGYYVVISDDNTYVIDNKYSIILDVSNDLIHKNLKKYDMIYENDTLMYMNQRYKKNSLIYEYYDIYTYELLKQISVGG